jgi:3-oxoadipate enol-lactonase
MIQPNWKNQMNVALTTMPDESWIDALELRQIDTSLGVVAVHIGGNQDGPAMVFWPSLMMTGTMWRFQYEHYAAGYRIVLIDSPGIGKSEALREHIGMRECSNCLVEILDALKIEKCIFVGNSWGAMLAGVFPAWHPERLVASIVVNGTASLPTMPETVKMTALAFLARMNAVVPSWWIPLAQAAFAGDTAEAEKPEFMNYINVVLAEDPKSIGFAMEGILLARKDQHALLRTIRNVPVLVVAGEEDRQFHVHTVRKMADAIEGSTFVVLPGTAHLASRESPDLVNAAMDKFLAGLAQPNPIAA